MGVLRVFTGRGGAKEENRKFQISLRTGQNGYRAHEGWRKDGFGRELDPQHYCTSGKSIPVYGLTELAGDFTVYFQIAGLRILSVMYAMAVLLE